MAARRRARPKERALDADPVLRSRAWPGPGVCAPRQISGRLKTRSAWRGGAPCAGSPAADGRTISHEATLHVDPHAIPMKTLVEHGIVLPPAAGRAEVDTHPAGCEPPGRGHAVDRAGALTIDDRAVPGNWEGDLIIGKKRGQRLRAPGRAHHALPRPGGPSPGTGRARPGAGALTRRIRALPDGAMSTLTWDQGSEMARHQRQGRRHREPGVFLRPPPQPLGKGHEREHQPPPRAATCPKAPPSPATNPYPGAIADEPGNCPRATLDHPTPQEAFTQLIATTP